MAVRVNTKVEAIVATKRSRPVRLSSGEEFKADMVILGIGALPNTLGREMRPRAGSGRRSKWTLHAYLYGSRSLRLWRLCRETLLFHGRPVGVMLASIAGRGAYRRSQSLFAGPSELWCHQRLLDGRQRQGLRRGRSYGAHGRQTGMEIVVTTAEAPDTHPGGMPNSCLTRSSSFSPRARALSWGSGIGR